MSKLFCVPDSWTDVRKKNRQDPSTASTQVFVVFSVFSSTPRWLPTSKFLLPASRAALRI